jgi:hypothetical protein
MQYDEIHHNAATPSWPLRCSSLVALGAGARALHEQPALPVQQRQHVCAPARAARGGGARISVGVLVAGEGDVGDREAMLFL